jgi:peptide chain release factor 1
MEGMLEKINSIEARFNELGQLLEQNVNDYQKVAELAKERSDLEPIVAKSQAYRQALKQIGEAQSLITGDDSELRELAQMDLSSLEPQAEQLEKDLRALLLPKDPRDDRNVIVEIRAGTGGDEAGCTRALPNVRTGGWKFFPNPIPGLEDLKKSSFR